MRSIPVVTAKKKATPRESKALFVPEKIAPLVHVIRHQKVLLDSDLAELYGVTTKRLNEAVKRNLDRFPSDFMFQLTEDEMEILRSQFVTLRNAETSLRSQSATLKRGQHAKYAEHDQQFQIVFDAIRRLIATEAAPKREMGFHAD